MKTNRKELFIPVIAFIFGVAAMYYYNLTWVKGVEKRTNATFDYFRTAYSLQQQLTENYNKAYDSLAQCLAVEQDKCDHIETAKKLYGIKADRDRLKSQLNEALLKSPYTQQDITR